MAVILASLALIPRARGQSPDDQYFQIYTTIQEADALNASGDAAQALAKYRDAQTALERIKRVYPTWNTDVVSFRMSYLADKIGEVSAKVPGTNSPPRLEESKPAASADATIALKDQIQSLQIQLRQLQAANTTLDAKLKEALAVQPAAVDPRELAKAEDRIRLLEKENDLLTVRLEQSRKPPGEADTNTVDQTKQDLAETNRKLAEQNAAVAKLAVENAALQSRIKELAGKASVSAPASDDNARIKQLERERNELQKQLAAAQRDLSKRSSRSSATFEDSDEVKTLRARLAVLEMPQVPYTQEELALLNKPAPKPDTNSSAGQASVKELSPVAAQLVAEARADFAAQRLPQAEVKYLQVLRQNPRNVSVLANVAAIQLEMNHLAEAERHIQQALAVAPDDAYTLSLLGNLRFRQERYDDALDALSRAAKLDPQNPEIQNYLGLALSQKGERKAAETAFRKAIELDPNYASAHNNLAVFYITAKPPWVALARWHYQKALAAGMSRNPDLEKLLDEADAAESKK